MMKFTRNTHHTVSRRRRTNQPRLEPLEARRLLSGFGPEDGAYIVQDRAGGDYRDIQIQPGNQAIVAVGGPGNSPYGDFAVERYLADGSLDTSYGNSGLANPALGPGLEVALAIVLQPDGKAVIAGSEIAGGTRNVGLARLNPDGSPDAGFGAGGWTGFSVQAGMDEAYSVGLQSTGKIVVAGTSNRLTTSPWDTTTFVARFTADGAIDSGTGGFGQSAGKGKNAARTGYALESFGARIAVQPDDKLIVAGGLGVARYTATGTLDKTFNRVGYSLLSLTGSATGVTLQADGKIVLVGSVVGIDGSDDMIVARFKSTGGLDTSFAGGQGYVRLDIDGTASRTQERATDVVIQPDGKIIVVANLQWDADLSGSVMVARINTNGTLDSSFGAGGIKLGSPLPDSGSHYFRGEAVALQSDGSIIVAGYGLWGATGDAKRPLLMRFFSGTQSATLQAVGSAAIAQSPTPVQVQPLLTAGIDRRQATGANDSGLGDHEVRITNLPDATVSLLASGKQNQTRLQKLQPGPVRGSLIAPGTRAQGRSHGTALGLVHETGQLLGREPHETA